MARPANAENRLEVLLQQSQRCRERAKAILETCTSDVSNDFETHYGLSVFQTNHLRNHLAQRPDWIELRINQDLLFSLLRELGWELAPIRTPAPCRKQVKAWKKVD